MTHGILKVPSYRPRCASIFWWDRTGLSRLLCDRKNGKHYTVFPLCGVETHTRRLFFLFCSKASPDSVKTHFYAHSTRLTKVLSTSATKTGISRRRLEEDENAKKKMVFVVTDDGYAHNDSSYRTETPSTQKNCVERFAASKKREIINTAFNATDGYTPMEPSYRRQYRRQCRVKNKLKSRH